MWQDIYPLDFSRVVCFNCEKHLKKASIDLGFFDWIQTKKRYFSEIDRRTCSWRYAQIYQNETYKIIFHYPVLFQIVSQSLLELYDVIDYSPSRYPHFKIKKSWKSPRIDDICFINPVQGILSVESSPLKSLSIYHTSLDCKRSFLTEIPLPYVKPVFLRKIPGKNEIFLCTNGREAYHYDLALHSLTQKPNFSLQSFPPRHNYVIDSDYCEAVAVSLGGIATIRSYMQKTLKPLRDYYLSFFSPDNHHLTCSKFLYSETPCEITLYFEHPTRLAIGNPKNWITVNLG
jgi:hypothetical protein